MSKFAIKILGKSHFNYLQKVLMKVGIIWVGRENDRSYRMHFDWLRGTTYLYFESGYVMNVMQTTFSSLQQVQYSLRCSNYKVLEHTTSDFLDGCNTIGEIFEALEKEYKSFESFNKDNSDEKQPITKMNKHGKMVDSSPAKKKYVESPISFRTYVAKISSTGVSSNKVISINNNLITIKSKSDD